MAKAFDDRVNDALRRVAREQLRAKFSDNQTKFAKALGVSAPFLSDFLNKKRGAGLETLIGLARFAPLEMLAILRIHPSVVVALIEGAGSSPTEAGLASLPESLRRAARAAIELTGCAPGDAGSAALELFAEHGDKPDADADWWLLKLRPRLTERTKSGERPSARLLLPASKQG